MSDDDPLTRAMREVQQQKADSVQKQQAHRQKSEQRLREIMPPLKEQVREALRAMPFFDRGVNESAVVSSPNTSNSAIDSFSFVASRSEPLYSATVFVGVVYDWAEPPSVGTPRVNAHGTLSRGSQQRMVQPRRTPFEVPIRVKQDGTLFLDAAAMVTSLTAAVTTLEGDGGSTGL